MVRTENAVQGVVDMTASYESAAENIKLILKKRYKLTSSDAKNAVETSPLKTIFEENTEMAAHTSNEAWARDIYEYWKKK